MWRRQVPWLSGNCGNGFEEKGNNICRKGDYMLTILFCLALVWLIWKMVLLGLKLTWGIAKFICVVLLLPVLLIGLVFAGLIYIAIPVLVIAGIVVLIKGIVET